MEHWLAIEELATHYTLDNREWDRISEVLNHVNVLVDNRTKELSCKSYLCLHRAFTDFE